MKYRKMLGDTIYRLRTAKGMSQAELGALVGVSNKAVSKWETDEANPDISLLHRLAEIFEISIDELLTDIKVDTLERKNRSKRILGFTGEEKESPEEYEFVSDKKTRSGLPYLHIHLGKKLSTINAKAHGVIAVGNNAKGIISIGFISKGILSVGLISFGVLALGLLSLGLLAFGNISVGLAASFGAISAGFVSFGAIAIGFIADGAIAIGYYAWGAFVIARHILWDTLKMLPIIF